MKFNSFLWSNFLESKEGEKSNSYFLDLPRILKDEKQHQLIFDYLNRFKIEKIDLDYFQFYAEEVAYLLEEINDAAVDSREEAKLLFTDIIEWIPEDQIGKKNPEFFYTLDEIDIISLARKIQ